MVAEKVFAVIAESTRRDILEALAQENKAVGQLVDELGVSQPTVSKHLRVLREAGVVTMRAQGQKRFYGINAEPLGLISAWLESLGAGTASTVAESVETPAALPSPAPVVQDQPVDESVPVDVAAPALPEAVTAASEQVVVGSVVPRQAMVPLGGGDASVQGQISRSVGRAANRAADLLANLPTLPKLRRKKD